MNNVTLFPTRHSAPTSDTVMPYKGSYDFFDPSPMVRLFCERDTSEAEQIVCRMLEDIALRLDMLQDARNSYAFEKMDRPAARIAVVADQIGLREVSIAAGHLRKIVAQQDDIALDAILARLERGFDIAVSEVWNFRDL